LKLAGARPFGHFVLGITGSIEAANSFQLVCAVRPICDQLTILLTNKAATFCAPETLEYIDDTNVHVDSDRKRSPNPTILAGSADIFCVAPLSANTLSKMAHGLADSTLLTVALAVRGIKVLAPSMSEVMWNNPLIQSNVALLEGVGFNLIPPVQGREVGSLEPQYGAMPRSKLLVDELCKLQRQQNQADYGLMKEK